MEISDANRGMQVSLNRSVKEVRANDGTVSTLSCVECPCEGFDGSCKCVRYSDGRDDIRANKGRFPTAAAALARDQ